MGYPTRMSGLANPRRVRTREPFFSSKHHYECGRRWIQSRYSASDRLSGTRRIPRDDSDDSLGIPGEFASKMAIVSVGPERGASVFGYILSLCDRVLGSLLEKPPSLADYEKIAGEAFHQMPY
jgi:hypothetical protein